jgi:DNA (cytosine-5)-methyltransferase 1
MKILNLYSGIGGNRKLWGDHQVTAVEIDPQIAAVYKKNFPNDEIVVADAHQYLLEHFKEFDFIWSSPPCPTHSRIRKIAAYKMRNGELVQQNKPVFPDMKLYEEILFLDGYAECKWVVENVISFYEPLIKPFEVGRHYFWANFPISRIRTKSGEIQSSVEDMMERKGFDITKEDDVEIYKVLRNCVEPELGLHIFREAFRLKQETISYDN